MPGMVRSSNNRSTEKTTMTLQLHALLQPTIATRAPSVQPKADLRLQVVRDALLAIGAGEWDRAAVALARDAKATARDPACLNLAGVVCQAQGQWRRARSCYGKAMRVGGSYAPAEQNLRRVYELYTFGRTSLPIALTDHSTMVQVRRLPETDPQDQSTLTRMSPWVRVGATMDGVRPKWDWGGYAWAIVIVALATAIGWPLVHSAHLHL